MSLVLSAADCNPQAVSVRRIDIATLSALRAFISSPRLAYSGIDALTFPLSKLLPAVAMAAALEESNVTYEELAEFEQEADDIDTDLSARSLLSTTTTAYVNMNQC